MFLKKRPAKEKRSPILAPPLRHAGQSVDEEIQKILRNKIDELLFWAALFWGLTLFEWFNWYFKLPPQPLILTILAILSTGYVFVRIRQYRRKIRDLKQARDGEKAVGQYLEILREKGYRILHDVVGTKFNIDHVLIGPAGVFTVETKTISKPVNGSAEIYYDGEKILINGFSPDRDPVVQAKAQAHWLQELIKESTGRTLKARPVVLYPGWFVSKQPKGADVWVLNPKSLPGFLEYESNKLATEDIQLVNFHVSRYVRGSASK